MVLLRCVRESPSKKGRAEGGPNLVIFLPTDVSHRTDDPWISNELPWAQQVLIVFIRGVTLERDYVELVWDVVDWYNFQKTMHFSSVTFIKLNDETTHSGVTKFFETYELT